MARLAATLSANVGDKIIASIFPELISCTVLIQWSGWHSGIHDRPLTAGFIFQGRKKHLRVKTLFFFFHFLRLVIKVKHKQSKQKSLNENHFGKFNPQWQQRPYDVMQKHFNMWFATWKLGFLSDRKMINKTGNAEKKHF